MAIRIFAFAAIVHSRIVGSKSTGLTHMSDIGAQAGMLAGVRRVWVYLNRFRLKLKMLRLRAHLDRLYNLSSSLAKWPASPQQDWLVRTRVKHYFRPTEMRRPPYFARQQIGMDREFALRQSDRELCLRQAKEIGLPIDRPIVTLHVREAGYKAQREEEARTKGKVIVRQEATRNADITTFYKAVDLLVARGIAVVRIGDPSMRPAVHPGMFDLATCPGRTGLMELFCLSISRFMIASESGPYHIAYLFGTPTLLVNATDMIGSYPVRKFDRYIFKRIVDRITGKSLTIPELVGLEHYKNFRNPDCLDYVDNSPDEIAAAVEEMLSVLEGEAATSKQVGYREQLMSAAYELEYNLSLPLPPRHHSYICKWGLDQGFLGHGFICKTFADSLSDGDKAAEA